MEAVATWGVLVFMVSMRLAPALFMTPIFTTIPVPMPVRVVLLFALALGIAPVIVGQVVFLPGSWPQLVLASLLEFSAGLVLGLAVRVVFGAFDVAGHFIDGQSGFAMSTLFNPASGQRMSVLGMAFSLAALIIFFGLDAHHALLGAFVDVYHIAPVGGAWSVQPEVLVTFFSKIFLFALMLAAPVVLVLWLTDLALAVVARSMPQFHVLFLAFPIKLFLVLILLAIAVPHWGRWLVWMFEELSRYWREVFVVTSSSAIVSG